MNNNEMKKGNNIELVSLDASFLEESFSKSDDDWYTVYLVDYMKDLDEWSKDGDFWTYNALVFTTYEDAKEFYDGIQQEALQSYVSELTVSVDDGEVNIGLDALCNGDYFKDERELYGIDLKDNFSRYAIKEFAEREFNEITRKDDLTCWVVDYMTDETEKIDDEFTINAHVFFDEESAKKAFEFHSNDICAYYSKLHCNELGYYTENEVIDGSGDLSAFSQD